MRLSKEIKRVKQLVSAILTDVPYNFACNQPEKYGHKDFNLMNFVPKLLGMVENIIEVPVSTFEENRFDSKKISEQLETDIDFFRSDPKKYFVYLHAGEKICEDIVTRANDLYLAYKEDYLGLYVSDIDGEMLQELVATAADIHKICRYLLRIHEQMVITAPYIKVYGGLTFTAPKEVQDAYKEIEYLEIGFYSYKQKLRKRS